MNNQKLEVWLRKVLFDYDEDSGPCVKLILRHVGAGKAQEIWQKRFKNGATTEDTELLELIQEIESVAFNDAEGLGGLQRYQVQGFTANSSTPISRFTFRMESGELPEEDELGLSEPASGKGLLGQMMRHNEALVRTAVLGANQTINQLQRQNHNLCEMVEKLTSDRRADFEVMEDLKSQRHERELLSLEAENKEKRYQELFDKASLLLPMAVNKLSGKKLLPQESTPEKEQVKAFAESLTPEQMTKLLGILNPAQQLAVLDLIQNTQPQDKEATKGEN